MKKAIFIDKDGTLIKDIPYNADINLITLEYYAGDALELFKQNGFLIIVISNQPGIAKGFFLENQLKNINAEIQRQLLPYNVQVDAFYYCPHFTGGAVKKYSLECNCRKPKPGLILQAAAEHNVNLDSSWMIGDILNDVEAGNTAGCKTVLLDNGNETEWILNEGRYPDFKVKNFEEAAKIIMREDKIKRKAYDECLAKL